MNNHKSTEEQRYAAMDRLREVFPAVEYYSDFDIEHLVEVMKIPARAVGNCISKEQLKTLCLQLLAENLTLQGKIKLLGGT